MGLGALIHLFGAAAGVFGGLKVQPPSQVAQAQTVVVETQDGLGSGVVLNSQHGGKTEWFVLTAAHVVVDESGNPRRKTYVRDAGKYYPSDLLECDAVIDAALLYLGEGEFPFRAARWATGDAAVGDTVAVCGARAGYEDTFFMCEVTDRFEQVEGCPKLGLTRMARPGCSGGPVFTLWDVRNDQEVSPLNIDKDLHPDVEWRLVGIVTHELTESFAVATRPGNLQAARTFHTGLATPRFVIQEWLRGAGWSRLLGVWGPRDGKEQGG